mgnify:CR=1 FL=1
MKILYDHQIFTLQNYGGISRYFCELIDQFSQDPDIEQTLALRYSRNENLCNRHSLYQHWSSRSKFLYDTQIFPVIRKIAHVDVLNCLRINQRESVRLLREQDFDLFHPTYYDSYFLQYLQQKPFILTVYDMIHELYPDYFSPNDPTKTWKKELIEQAEAIIAISESTKNDIIKFTNVDPERISVVYLGNPFEYLDQPHQHKNKFEHPILEEPYILFVGNRTGYKNFIFFIKSVAKLLKEDKNLRIYCAGGGPFTQPELKILNELNVLSKVRFVETNDLIIKHLYENAQVFIFPSLYEGFGLPILEAFSCGCPALLSNSSSLSEVGGDAAGYFDPNDQESLIQSIETVLSDDHYREKLIRKGFERLKLFSWENTAHGTKKVYDNLSYQ